MQAQHHYSRRHLAAASGDLRNVILTVNGLPHDYSGLLTIVMNDRDHFVTLRNILLLQILGTVPDQRKAADIALHLWYSALMPAEYHMETVTRAAQFGAQKGPLDVALGQKSRMYADVDSDVRMLATVLAMAWRKYGTQQAAEEVHRVWCVLPSLPAAS